MASDLLNPIPGTTRQNNGGYRADSGLDILVPEGTRCVAAGNGVLEYAELGHTPWPLSDGSRPYSVLIRLDDPIEWNGRKYIWIWYTHLKSVNPVILGKTGIVIRAGDLVGFTGSGNGVPHLHFGIVADRAQNEFIPHDVIASMIWDISDDDRPGPVLKVAWHNNKLSVVHRGKQVWRTDDSGVIGGGSFNLGGK